MKAFETTTRHKGWLAGLLALALLATTACGGSRRKPMIDPMQDDSLALAIADSIMLSESDTLEVDSIFNNKKFTESYVRKRAFDVYDRNECFSQEYKQLHKEMTELARELKVEGVYFDDQDYDVWYGGKEECDNSNYRLESVRMLAYDRAEARFMAHNCGDYASVVTLVYENGDWFVDDIGNDKTQSLKTKMQLLINSRFNLDEDD